MKFKYAVRNWVEYRKLLPDMVECDFHWMNEPNTGSYYENMQAVRDSALRALVNAQADGKRYVMFTHGGSTSGVGKTTSRSQVRKLMRSKEATPYIVRRDCIEQDTVFVAAIRSPNALAEPPVVMKSVNRESTSPQVISGKQAIQILSGPQGVPEQSSKIHFCISCGTAVSQYVAKHCLHALGARLGGKIYCMDCLMKV